MGPLTSATFQDGNVTVADAEVAVSGSGDATAGNDGAAVVHRGTAIAGDSGLAVAQYKSVCEAGAGGFALCMESGRASSGENGRSLVGPDGRAKAGPGGILFLGYFNETEEVYRYVVAYVGENGIAPDTYYRADENGVVHPAP